MAWLRRSGLEGLRRKIACVGKGIGEGIDTLDKLTHLVPYTGFGTRSVGAADAASSQDREYCWYATWLLGNKETDALKEGRIEPSALYKQLLNAFLPLPFFLLVSKEDITFDTRNRKVMKGDKVIAEGIDDWTSLSVFVRLAGDRYTFKHFRPETMEKLAYGTAVAGNILETVLHLVSLEEGDYLSNSFNASLNGIFTT